MNSRKLTGIIVIAVLLCVFAAARIANAAQVDFFLKVTGTQQGQFKGEVSTGSTAQIPAAQFKYQAIAAQDAAAKTSDQATAAPVGRRAHSSITIVKEIGAASPMFAKALSSNEVLRSVDIEFVHPGPAGAPEIYKTMHLTNAIISSIRQLPGNGKSKLEEITFIVQPVAIEVMAKNGNKTAIDDWLASK
jgi:type VI secretion system Hcp family effector